MQASFFVLELVRGTPTRAFFEAKSLESVENKGSRLQKVVKSLELVDKT
jgi:hypothetical protein